MLRLRQSGSRGTDTSRWRRATRAISSSVASGSGHVLQHLDRARQVELVVAKDSRVASSARNSRFGRERVSHSARSLASSRSMPTTRPSPSRSAHSAVSTPSPQPTSSTDPGAARSQTRRARMKARHQALDDRFEPYLSNVLPVGTAPAESRPGARAPGPPGRLAGGGRSPQLERLPLLRCPLPCPSGPRVGAWPAHAPGS